jgi:hypothetical protein
MSSASIIIAVAALGFIACTVGALWTSYRLAEEAQHEARLAPYHPPTSYKQNETLHIALSLLLIGGIIWLIFFR